MGELPARYEVWVDADLCGGCGDCVATAPEVFTHVDGLSHVINDGYVLESGTAAPVAPEAENAVIRAAEECPGEIIFVTPRQS